MSRLRIVTWNCHSGSAAKRLAELADYDPHVVFLQECTAVDSEPTSCAVSRRTITGRKGIALLAPANSCRCVARKTRDGCGRAVIAAQVLTPVRFRAIGIWARGPHYAQDVVRTLQAHRGELRRSPTVVIGDFNSGTRLGDRRSLSRNHHRILDAFATVGMVSAYHAFHRIEPGAEQHATYFHQFNESLPWHIDFCFVPLGWTSHLVDVVVINSRQWKTRSDHRPLLVELEI